MRNLKTTTDWRRIFLIFCCLSFLPGCTVLTVDMGAPVDTTKLNLEAGKTHYRDVLAGFGLPNRIGSVNDCLALMYDNSLVRENQFSLIPDNSIIKFTHARAAADRYILILVFNDKGFLKSAGYQKRNEKLGSATAIQFFITIVSTVDPTDFTKPYGPNDWGMLMLRPLPQTLNNQHALRSGAAGLEQIGTPLNVGAHSLEMH